MALSMTHQALSWPDLSMACRAFAMEEKSPILEHQVRGVHDKGWGEGLWGRWGGVGWGEFLDGRGGEESGEDGGGSGVLGLWGKYY
ncbi:hypothetical protein DVH24_005009 [Malus domestica]|uniref:Uncharacterized protein n=1 Tax=Malus domestica TaxID=3750 RepID=A0A498IG49_MALDO|nr:hypothetical protein DVH24_005009 [Malus domestica]